MEDVPLSLLFALLALLILLSAFFSSSETGLIALNPYRLRHRVKSGHRGARLAQRLLAKPDRMIGLILLGNNLVNILAASIATVIALRLIGESGIWVSTALLTVVILIFAEVAPKTIAALRPEIIAYPASYVLRPLLKVLYPLVWLINAAANLLLRLLGFRPQHGIISKLTREEIKTLLSESGGTLSGDHQAMLLNILDLENASIDEVMVPRNEIVALDLAAPWTAVLDTLAQAPYTRLPAYRGDLDHLEGVLHVRTIVRRLAGGQLAPEDLQRALRAPYFVPEGTLLTQQLLEFQRLEQRLGLVVDEYGQIAGLITLDDILEEIVGEFTTEEKSVKKLVRRLDDSTWLVDGSANLRMLNRRFDWNLPTATARTLNGLLLEHLETIPTGPISVRIGDHLMTIKEIADNTIRKIVVKPYHAGKEKSA